MKTIRFTHPKSFLFFVFFLLSFSSFAQGFSPSVTAKLQHVLDSIQNNPDSPVIGGISAAINVDGLALWKGATGFAARNIDEQNNLLPGGTHFTPDTLSRLYSVTKTFTAALTLDLANEGVFSLNNTVGMFLPLLPFVNPGLNTNVTIRQLLSHESGYSDYTTDPNFQVALAANPTHIWTPYETVSFAKQEAAPGGMRKYSSTNYLLLGAIIEAATGTPVEQLYRQRYLDKLHLSSIYFDGRESIGSRGSLAAPHDNVSPLDPVFAATGQPLFPDTITNIMRLPFDGVVSSAFSAGAMVGNATDVSSWGNALFGGHATHPATIDSMIHSIASYPDESGDYLGYGVFSNHKISQTDSFIGHTGNALGYKAIMFYQPDRKMTIAVLMNSSSIDSYGIGRALYAALPNFLCGEKEKRVTVCFKGYTACVPRLAGKFLIKRGAYLGSCGQPCTNTDSLLVAELSSSELAAVGMKKETVAKDALTVYPNPVHKQAMLSISTAQQGMVSLRVFDVSGVQKTVLFSGRIEKGLARQVVFNASNLPAGVYIAALQTASGITRQKIVVE